MEKVMICDDDRDIVSAIDIYLTEAGYQTVLCYHAAMAKEFLQNQSDIDLILLDIMMPGMDGLHFTEELRTFSNLPVILLTAKSEEQDKVKGLDAGADDYITKPFIPTELLARVRSQLRRYHTLGSYLQQEAHILTIGGIQMDTINRTVAADGQQISLTKTEYRILEILMRSPGKIFSSEELYEKLHGDKPYAVNNTIAVHIRHLREKIEVNPNNPRYLTIIWGQGYRISDDYKISNKLRGRD